MSYFKPHPVSAKAFLSRFLTGNRGISTPSIRLFRTAICVIGLCFSVSAAHAQCEIIEDAGLYAERKEQAIMLMQYGDNVVRATDGKIRCTEDAGNARQVCEIDGPGEMLIDAVSADVVVRLEGDGVHVVHLSSKGSVTCAN